MYSRKREDKIPWEIKRKDNNSSLKKMINNKNI